MSAKANPIVKSMTFRTQGNVAQLPRSYVGGRIASRKHGTFADYGRFVRAWLNSGKARRLAHRQGGDGGPRVEDHLEWSPLPKPMDPTVPERAKPVELFTCHRFGVGFHLYVLDLPANGHRLLGRLVWCSTASF